MRDFTIGQKLACLKQYWPSDLAPRFLLIALIAAAILLLAPFLRPSGKAGKLPRLAWSPGYWELVPGAGIGRIVPTANWRLINPAAGAKARMARGQSAPF